eukprot:TRINITY_DN22257_c0_g1_i1.p1 TRINITY_DN22257_c0_g1~~TRINITY_DN22257_c0_g1_i1.p1  ORF type:complete len:306 (+),score=137.10 TRINITY_DN22257_c0_g1_i1:52-918(+)
MANAARGITRVVRFLNGGKVYLGEQPKPGQADVAVLRGDALRPRDLEYTGERLFPERLLAPLDPPQIFCIGMNYMKHYEESGKKRGVPLPTKPAIFMKAVSSLNHPDSPVWMPQVDKGDQLDYEVELAFVIGKHARNVSRLDALDYVLGYMVSNDVSSRHWQKNAGASQWIKGKSFDTFTPLGPALVMASEVPDPQALQLTTHVNGELRQNSNTKDMIFSVAEIIEWLSADMTLLPGTVIMTGTPEGVIAGMDKPVWLKPGDVMTCEIEKLGALTNYVAAGPTHASKL